MASRILARIGKGRSNQDLVHLKIPACVEPEYSPGDHPRKRKCGLRNAGCGIGGIGERRDWGNCGIGEMWIDDAFSEEVGGEGSFF
jgi:hypothetical protein